MKLKTTNRLISVAELICLLVIYMYRYNDFILGIFIIASCLLAYIEGKLSNVKDGIE